MNFPNTALFVRSLTMDNKHWQNYLLRWIMLVLIGFSLLQYLMHSLISTQNRAPGLEFFEYIATLNLIFITILGITLFAGAITEEKEVGSLNLLLMTGLTAFTLILSKSTSKLIVGLMLILAQLPFSIMAITLGGVSMRQILAVYAVFFAYTFFICNLALFFSVVTSRTYKAASWTFLVLSALYLLALNNSTAAQFSPFVITSHILKTGFTGSILNVQILAAVGGAGILFFSSIILFNYFTRINTNSNIWRIPWSSSKRFNIFPISRTWKNAVAWKEFFFSSGGTFGILSISIIMLLIIGYGTYSLFSHHLTGNKDIGMLLLTTGLIFFALQCIYISSTIFNHEIEGKTFSTLIMLPISLKKIAYSKIIGGSFSLIPATVVIIAALIILSDFLQNIPLSINSLGGTSMIISGGVQFIFYLYLVTLFSLKIRYGGFVMAGIVYFIIQIGFGIPSMMIAMVSAIPFGMMGNFYGEIFAIVTSAITIGLYIFAIIFTHRLIGRRLTELT
jgi:hypothetical protein